VLPGGAMNHFTTKTCWSAAALAVLVFAAGSAQAQLAMSYGLEVRPENAQHAPAVVNRCAGFNWMSSIGACGRELLARVTPGGRPDSGATFEAGPGAATPDLPTLGTSAPEPRLSRSAGGRETLIGSSKTADLLFRFGSKYRIKSSEEGGWEWYRFSDITYDNYVKANGHKAVGVELLVPFQ